MTPLTHDHSRDIEVIGGPFDGTAVLGVGREWIGRVFSASDVGHLYRRMQDDTGCFFWAYAGVVALRSTQAA